MEFEVNLVLFTLRKFYVFMEFEVICWKFARINFNISARKF